MYCLSNVVIGFFMDSVGGGGTKKSRNYSLWAKTTLDGDFYVIAKLLCGRLSVLVKM